MYPAIQTRFQNQYTLHPNQYKLQIFLITAKPEYP